MLKARIEKDFSIIDDGNHLDEPIEWWYYNTILSAPGSPVDGWAFITIFTIFRNVIETVHGLLVPPAGDAIDLSGYELAPNSINTSAGKVGISWNKNRCQGNYPRWTVHIEGKDKGKTYGIDLEIEAAVSSNFYKYLFEPSYLNHFVVFRNQVRGTVSIDENTYPVTGLGYYEHFYGFLDLMSFRGWHWYWSPQTEQDNLAVNVGLGVEHSGNIPCSFMHFTPNGKDFFQFEDLALDIVEEKKFGGITYPTQFQVQAIEPDKEFSIMITRTPSSYTRLNESPFGSAIFVTGFASFEGRVIWGKNAYNLGGCSLGSAMLFAPKDF